MKILLITSNLPYPLITGAKIRVWNLLKRVAQYHDITLLSLLDSSDELQFLPHLQQYCTRVEVVVKQRQRSRGKLLRRLLRTVLKGQPPRNGIAYYEEMRRKIEEVTGSQSFDVIHIEQSHMAPYIEFITDANSAAQLVTLYDVGAVQQRRILKAQSGFQDRLWTWFDWFFLRRWEPAYLDRHFDKCIVVSAVDEALLREANPALSLVVVPNGVDTVQHNLLPEFPDSREILFIGKMNYPPNVDSVLFFYQEIFPLVQSRVPQARLLIVGINPAPEIRALAADSAVEITGYVEDILPYYRRACLSAVPLRAAGGTRLKILESMAIGRPVVSTTVGCEGLAVTHGKDILIADTPADFADQTIQLLCNKAVRQRLVANGRRLVETRYDWQIIAQRILRVYEEVVDKSSLRER